MLPNEGVWSLENRPRLSSTDHFHTAHNSLMNCSEDTENDHREGKRGREGERKERLTGNSRTGAAVRSHCQHWMAVVMATSVKFFTGSWVTDERRERWSWGRCEEEGEEEEEEEEEGQVWRRRAVQRYSEVTN